MLTAGAGVSVETGWRVKVTESLANKANPAVGSSALFALVDTVVVLIEGISDKLEGLARQKCSSHLLMCQHHEHSAEQS